MPRPLRALTFNSLVPAALYALLFYALTFPLLHSFNTRFFCGDEDGYQNIWNLWWLNKSLGEFHQLPWHTTYLHHPHGTSLLAHTLSPINAAFAVPMLSSGFELHHVYNTIVVFGFVMTGVTTFWLARRLTGAYAPALFAGAAYTFSHFHFAHAQNHLQLVGLQWLPLAVLAVYELFTRPKLWKAPAAAAALLLVALTDFHLTFYAVIAGLVLGGFVLARLRREQFADLRPHLAPVALFLLLAAGTTGLLAWKLLALNRADPLQQNHEAHVWSTDVVDVLLPGAQWRFHALTRPIWSTLAPPQDAFVYVEHSLYPTWAIIALCAYAFRHRATLPLRDATYWFTLLAVFFILSLGPWLHVAGVITWIPGVYRPLEWLFPPLKVAGVPMRMMAAALLIAAVISTAALAHLSRRPPATKPRDSSRGPTRPRRAWVVIALLALWVFETLPKPHPTTPLGYPAWVTFLSTQPPGAVVDTTYQHHMTYHLYYATGHGHPVGEGYISRYPLSVEQARGRLRKLVDDRRFDELRDQLHFRYVVTPDAIPLKRLFEDPSGMIVYDLTVR